LAPEAQLQVALPLPLAESVPRKWLSDFAPHPRVILRLTKPSFIEGILVKQPGNAVVKKHSAKKAN